MKKIVLLLSTIYCYSICVGQSKLINKANFLLNNDSTTSKEVKVTIVPFSNCACIGDSWNTKKIREIEGSILLISIVSTSGTELLLNLYTTTLQEAKYDVMPDVFPHNLINLSNFCPNSQAFKVPFVSFKKWQLKRPLVFSSFSTTKQQSSYRAFKTGNITITKLDNMKRTITATFNFATTHADGGPLLVTDGNLEINY